MFRDFLLKWVEPMPDSFDAYFYDENGIPHHDFTNMPEFLRESMEFFEPGSGTHKFLFLLYKFASRAKFGIECGVWNGSTTVSLAKGLDNNNGTLISVDLNVNRPLLHERLKKHDIRNVKLYQGNNLGFRSDNQNFFDLIYIDTDHTYEHTVRELFLFDRYLKEGGVFILHDIVSSKGVDLIDSSEDYGYSNTNAVYGIIEKAEKENRRIHVSDFPILKPTPNCLMSPVYLGMQTFLSYRPSYKVFKILDCGGLGIIWKLS